MNGLEICTSKPGKLWPIGYWKSLIDALSHGGGKLDPFSLYRDLAKPLTQFVEKRGTRFLPKKDTPLAESDDSALRVIILRRARVGQEVVKLGQAELPTLTHWKAISFPFFGTIGNSEYEAQSKLNRESLIRNEAEVLSSGRESRFLGLAFQQSTSKRDRDLDNLTDALIPVFDSRVPLMEHIVLMKLDSSATENEFLYITTNRRDLGIASVR